MNLVIVDSRLSCGVNVELVKELDAEPEKYEICLHEPATGVIKVERTANNMADALAFYSQVIKGQINANPRIWIMRQ